MAVLSSPLASCMAFAGEIDMDDVQKLRKAVDDYRASLGKELSEMTGEELEKYLALLWAWYEATGKK